MGRHIDIPIILRDLANDHPVLRGIRGHSTSGSQSQRMKKGSKVGLAVADAEREGDEMSKVEEEMRPLT